MGAGARAFVSAEAREWHVSDDESLVPRSEAVTAVGRRVPFIGARADHLRFSGHFSVCVVCAPDLQSVLTKDEPTTAQAVAYAMSQGELFPHRRRNT